MIDKNMHVLSRCLCTVYNRDHVSFSCYSYYTEQPAALSLYLLLSRWASNRRNCGAIWTWIRNTCDST